MSKKAEMSEIDVFLAGPLVKWFSSCLEEITDEKVTYEGLAGGYLIHNVFLQMDLDVHDTNVYPSTVDSAAWRSRNLRAILDNLRHCYEEELKQVILRLPDVEVLGREPDSQVRELQLLLGLLLGCAVQCPNKEIFVGRIQRLDEANQLAIAECIAQVIRVPGIVLNAEMLTDSLNGSKVIECVRQICWERDDYKKQLHDLRKTGEEQLSDDYCEKLQLKFKVMNLEEQLLQKIDEIEDINDQLNKCTKKLSELSKANEKLVLENKNVRFYRDELDVANAAAEKAERLEQEIVRYRKKLNELNSSKNALTKSQERNRYLEETNANILKEMKSLKVQKGEKLRELESQVTQLKQQVKNLTAENAENRSKYQEICEKKMELERLWKVSNVDAKRGHSSMQTSKKNKTNIYSGGMPSKKDDLLLNDANSKIAKLEKDNESLMSYIETLKEHLFSKSSIISSLTQDNKKLIQKFDGLRESFQRQVETSQKLEHIAKTVLKTGQKLQQQELERLRSLLENAQKQPTDISEQIYPKSPLVNSSVYKKNNMIPKPALLKIVRNNPKTVPTSCTNIS